MKNYKEFETMKSRARKKGIIDGKSRMTREQFLKLEKIQGKEDLIENETYFCEMYDRISKISFIITFDKYFNEVRKAKTDCAIDYLTQIVPVCKKDDPAIRCCYKLKAINDDWCEAKLIRI